MSVLIFIRNFILKTHWITYKEGGWEENVVFTFHKTHLSTIKKTNLLILLGNWKKVNLRILPYALEFLYFWC